MAKRKSLSKKIRFEVLKRDSFTCQYCGKRAPDVILAIDHINPVANGGDNDLINLITSCHDCNSGKGARLLSDQQVLQKQMDQLALLNERREQLEMIVEWKKGLLEIDNDAVEKAASYFNAKTTAQVSDHGKNELNKWIKKYTFSLILDCISVSCDQYLRLGSDGKVTRESVENAFNMIGRIAYCKHREKNNPELSKLYHCRSVLHKRLHGGNKWKTLKNLREAYDLGVSADELMELSKTVRNWTSFMEYMEFYGVETRC